MAMTHSCQKNLIPEDYFKKKKILDTSKKNNILKVHVTSILKMLHMCT